MPRKKSTLYIHLIYYNTLIISVDLIYYILINSHLYYPYSICSLFKDGTPQSTTFTNLQTQIKAEESEEIGVEQLLRDIQREDTTTMAVDIESKLRSLETLGDKLASVHLYLERVLKGSVPLNQGVCYALQGISYHFI